MCDKYALYLYRECNPQFHQILSLHRARTIPENDAELMFALLDQSGCVLHYVGLCLVPTIYSFDPYIDHNSLSCSITNFILVPTV